MSEQNSRFPGPATLDIESEEKVDSSDHCGTADSTSGPAAVLSQQDEKPDTESPLDPSREDGEGQFQAQDSGGGQQMSRSKTVLITIALCVRTCSPMQ